MNHCKGEECDITCDCLCEGCRIPYTNATRSELATQVVESWDMDTLINAAIGSLADAYRGDTELFKSDWKIQNEPLVVGGQSTR